MVCALCCFAPLFLCKVPSPFWALIAPVICFRCLFIGRPHRLPRSIVCQGWDGGSRSGRRNVQRLQEANHAFYALSLCAGADHNFAEFFLGVVRSRVLSTSGLLLLVGRAPSPTRTSQPIWSRARDPVPRQVVHAYLRGPPPQLWEW